MNSQSIVSPKLKRIPSLDGLRAFSILLVIFGHASSSLGAFVSENANLWRVVANQHLGVSFFFVLSGFLITNILINEHQRTKTIHLRRFYLRRTFRILPAFYFMLLIVGILALVKVLNVRLVDWLAAPCSIPDVL